MTKNVLLRDVRESDLPIFFRVSTGPCCQPYGHFTAKDPAGKDAFNAHWSTILGDAAVNTIAGKVHLINTKSHGQTVALRRQLLLGI